MHKVLGIVVLMAVVFVGCTHKPAQSSPSPSGGGRLDERLTLQQAQEKVPFTILMPNHLPTGVVFEYAKTADGTNYVLDAKGPSVLIMFAGGGQGFGVVEQQGVMGHLDRGVIKKVSVNNTEAEYSENEKPFETNLLWQEGNVVCRIYSNMHSSFAKEKGLIEIASSFKFVQFP
ncbi:hypothetical protein E5161_13030 [Cohnella pontilimi]|uniref:DUF4367 domain-containing protein n=1 Tax=Cohnella pontilimi TaxID=2564100 RepID=A0A4U0F9M6_9BACL|nr:hypothetical protein [Cohnella pontilimi]TJY41341.1 hypothetical protein E5161_13030 [Cohnella pontilimi]